MSSSPPADSQSSEGERQLNRSDLTRADAQAVLGLLVARQLIEYGQSTVYIDLEGNVAVCAPGEVGLDSLPEEMAINTLSDQGWTDEEVANYLKGRDARLRAG